MTIVALRAANAQPSDEELGKALTSPIAPIAHIPFQLNWDNGVGANDALQFTLKIEPVVPFSLTDSWNLIGRFILPITAKPPGQAGGSPTFGMGEIELSLFASPVPSPSAHFIWGLGPVLGLPTGTDASLGGDTWQAGPTGVARYEAGPWTATLLVNQLWSFADTSSVDTDKVSKLFVQPVLGYTWDSWTLTAESETTINWYASDGKWELPLELLVSKLTRIAAAPFKVQVGGGWFAASPSGGPEWRLRLNLTVVLKTRP